MSTQFICTDLIDIANFALEYDEIFYNDVNEHLTLLDPIGPITSDLFHSIFYQSSNDFNLIENSPPLADVIEYVSLADPYRKYLGENYSLTDNIIDNLTGDLNTSLSAFTPCSVIALNSQLVNLKTFYDLGSVPTCNLTWSEIVTIVDGNCDYPAGTETFVAKLVINITFTTPTLNVKPTRVRYVYEVEFPVQ